ncbi:uncharacterized protein [Spinacia oleracea]|uniref:Uncharacterized protein isoform X3 n=1 Tax=Spinacia oleracea TaxID=3562 RepID=A0ABM3QTC6_SPIOL|nr:uncharacterized protein LOC130462436 isoform X3 [Spinacia oleracea]
MFTCRSRLFLLPPIHKEHNDAEKQQYKTSCWNNNSYYVEYDALACTIKKKDAGLMGFAVVYRKALCRTSSGNWALKTQSLKSFDKNSVNVLKGQSNISHMVDQVYQECIEQENKVCYMVAGQLRLLHNHSRCRTRKQEDYPHPKRLGTIGD